MSIKYVYLEPGSPFSAAAINSRFDAAQTGISDLAIADLSVGALNAEHMPSPIGQHNVEPTEQVFTVESNMAFGTTNRYDEGSGWTKGGFLTQPVLTFNPPLVLGMDEITNEGGQRVSAVILLANVAISDMALKTAAGISLPGVGLDGLNESKDGLALTFYITSSLSGGTAIPLTGSQRATSPGATIKYGDTNPFPNDHNCDRDIAMRYVVTSSMLEDLGLSNIEQVRIGFERPGFGDWYREMSFTISKYNMTAIPIHSSVGEVME